MKTISHTASIVKRQLVKLGVCTGLIMMLVTGCQEDYVPFDETPAFVIGKPKIRFVNLHFFKSDLTLNIGNGKLIKNNLHYRDLTAFEEAPEFLLERTPFFVSDESGAILLEDTISIREANNYTFYISPSYKSWYSNYQVVTASGSPKIRHMASIISDKVGYAFIADPVSSALADRASIRQLTLSPSLSRSGLPNFVPASQNFNADILTRYTFVPLRTDNAPDYSSGPSFINFGYQVGPPDNYITYVGTGQFDRAFNLGTLQPITFKAGKSYTVVTNGTVGLGNDVENADDVIPETSNNPLKLKPVPYEVFILEDADGSARTLTPMPLDRMSRQVAKIVFVNLNSLWKSAYPNAPLIARINGAHPRVSTYLIDGSTEYESIDFGNQIIDVAISTLSRPLITSAEATLSAGGKYFAFHYLDGDNKTKLKVIQADTVAKYNAVIRVNFANFSPDLEPVNIRNAETGQILISDITFTEVSNSIELPVERHFIGTKAVLEKVAKLEVVRPETGEVLFEIALTQNYFDGTTNLIFNEASQGQRNSAFIYTVIFSGRYNATDEIQKFRKTIFAFEKADKPTHNYENVFDWQAFYGELP